MSSLKFPSFNYPYTASEDLRQFLVDYGRTGPVHVFKNGQNVECIPQKKECHENAGFISEKPTLPLNLPGKIEADFMQQRSQREAQFAHKSEQAVTNFAVDNGGILFEQLAGVISNEVDQVAKTSWRRPDVTLAQNGAKLDSVLKRLKRDFCDIPVEILTGLNKESDKETNLIATGKYYGNCLTFARSTSSDSGILLVSPRGPTMSELCFSHLDINCGEDDTVRLAAQTGNFNLPDRICEISMTNEIDEGGVIAVRTQDYKCWFFKNESCDVSERPTFLGNLLCKTTPCSIAVNPYIPEEVVVSMETGSMWLWNSGDSSVQVTRQCSSCTPAEFDWYFTEFGSHPRQVVRGNAANVEIIDLRGDSSASQDLMTLPSPHFFTDDKFTAIKRYYDNPYHYILATTQSLAIMDTRFQQYPVLKWCHSLEYPVKHINALPNPASEDVLVFVGSYESHDVHCFQYCYGENWSSPLGYADDLTGVLPPRHTSNPWKISSINEWSELFDFPNKAQSYPSVRERLNQPLLGLSCISESTKKSVLVLQLSNTGDLFYEQLAPRESQVQNEANVHEDFQANLKGCSVRDSKQPNLGENDQEFITKWVECLMDHVNKENKDTLDDLNENCQSTDAGIIKEELFSYLEEYEIECCLCNDNSSRETSPNDTISASCSSDELVRTECPYCKMPKDLSDRINKFRKADDHIKILTKKSLDLKYKAEPLKLFDDGIQCNEPLGNVLLRNWYSDEQIPVDLTGKKSNE